MTVEEAKNHVITRLVAAALGAFSRVDAGRLEERLLADSSRGIDDTNWTGLGVKNLGEVLERLGERLRVAHAIPQHEQISFILLFDEITTLSSALKTEKERRTFFSFITAVINSSRAVVISGFHRAQTVLGLSDRKKADLALPPLKGASTSRRKCEFDLYSV